MQGKLKHSFCLQYTQQFARKYGKINLLYNLYRQKLVFELYFGEAISAVGKRPLYTRIKTLYAVLIAPNKQYLKSLHLFI